jgi:hypothetical protein
MSRKNESITLSIKERDKASLEQLAIELGMMWGDRPNISKLVEAIARRQIQTSKNNDWADDRIKALDRIFRLLIDYGELDLATAIATLLLERNELDSPLRRNIERFLDQPPEIWRQTLDRFIKQQQPFRLIYRDANDRPWSFSILYAKISPHDSRQYLDCWCQETEGNTDIPALQHNRCLRLDRIPEAAITPIKAKWRSRLDTIPVTIHLAGTLAFAYKPKTGDIKDEWINPQFSDNQPMREITREISNTFWFFREILPYAEDCIIAQPAIVRLKLIEKLQTLCARYEGINL